MEVNTEFKHGHKRIKDLSVRYSCTFWSRAPGHEPAQCIVYNEVSLWRAWWTMTKLLWRSRRYLWTAQDREEKPDPTRTPSGEQPSVSVE